MFGPVLVHPVKNTVKDPFAAVAGGEGAHGADASAHFHTESFNHVGESYRVKQKAATRSSVTAHCPGGSSGF